MNHQRLHCYQRLLCVARTVPSLLANIPAGYADLQDQLKRALTSAILNLAEGNGRRSWKEKNRFFDISIASIDEVDAACDLLVAFALVPFLVIEPVQRDLRISAAMIMKLRSL